MLSFEKTSNMFIIDIMFGKMFFRQNLEYIHLPQKRKHDIRMIFITNSSTSYRLLYIYWAIYPLNSRSVYKREKNF